MTKSIKISPWFTFSLFILGLYLVRGEHKNVGTLFLVLTVGLSCLSNLLMATAVKKLTAKIKELSPK